MFILNLSLTAARSVEMKLDLAKSLPWVKSSHRVEAIARSLGFKTHASLLAATHDQETVPCIVEGSKFVSYLAEHGFEVTPIEFYVAAARTAIRDVLEKVPNLTMAGIGSGQPQRKNGQWETPEQHYARQLEWREEFFRDGSSMQFLLALAFIQRVKAIKTIGSGRGSYGLKHIAENFRCTFPEGAELGPRYVANGALIAAAVHAGFKFRKYFDHLGYESLNVSFNMSKASVDDLDCEIRPNGAVAQSRKYRRLYAA